MLRTFRTIPFLFLFAATTFAQKSFQDGQAARAVIGQFTFTKGDQNPTGQILGGPGGIAWAGNRLYVADSNRLGATPNTNRVLVFDTTLVPTPYTDLTVFAPVQGLTNCYVCGTPAMFALGQDTLTPPTYTPQGQSTSVTAYYNGVNGSQDPAGSNPTENAWLYNATAVASDGVRLAVADTDNNRVLLWNSLPNGNQHPDLVVGQPDFNTLQAQQLGVVNATSMRGPQGVWIANNKLYVADTQDYRVLIWNSWPTKNNQAPDVVLGQPDFNHANAPPPSTTSPTAAANQLLNPVSVTADGGHVFVSDLGFNRVLIWNTISPGMDQNADVVIGQLDFIQTTANNSTVCGSQGTGIQGQCASSLNFPRFALSDGTRLFVADGGNDRVLIFDHIPTSNGVQANGILGQTNFQNDIVTSVSISIVSTEVDNTGGVDTTPSPTSLAYDGTNLYVTDPFNRRVLLFSPGDSRIPSAFDTGATVIPVVNWASEIIRQEGTVTFSVTAGGKITSGDTASIAIGENGTTNTYTYTEKNTDTLDNIAKALVAQINKSDPFVTALFGGPGSATVYLSSKATSGAASTSLGYDSITLTATASNTANITATASGSYLSAGNAATASPGALIEVNAPAGVTFTDNGSTYVAPLDGKSSVPNNVNGVQLYLDGFASPLFKVSKSQLVGQVPYFYGDRNSTSVYVRTTHNNGSVTVTNATPVYIAPANPGIFNAQQYPNQARPWPIAQARHQLGRPLAVISVDGSPTVGDTVSVYVNVNTQYKYTVQTGDTLQSVVNGLIALMQNDPNVTPSNGGAFTRLVLTATPAASNGGNGISISTGTGTASGGDSSCSVTSSATETLTPYGSSGNDSLCHPTITTCCAVVPGSLIYPGNPAVPGELISIAAAGMGGIQNAAGNDITGSVTTGFPYTGPAPPNNDVLSPNFVAATMGGESAQVIFAGLDTGSYGIYRVDVLVPTGLPTLDTTPLYIAQNAFISNTVTVAVGPAVSNPPPPPSVVTVSPINLSIDTPTTPALGSVTTVSGNVQIAGWAVDSSAAITNVAIQIDGITIGTATYGISRADVCPSYPTALNCPNVGYSYMFDTTRVSNGAHTLQVLVTDQNGLHRTNANGVDLFVNNDSAASHTHVSIDTPATTGEIYHGIVLFAGWATNDTSPIVSFKGYLDGAPIDGTQVKYGLSRPDVCAVTASPNCPNVGWNYVADLTLIPNSSTPGGTLVPHTFTLTAIAANGQQYTVSSQFIVNNFAPADLYSGPSITIDIPSATAGTLSGTTAVAGWVIDPFTTVSSVQVTVDGISFGNIPYGNPRGDVCAIFTNAPGCPNVGFSGNLDTTFLSDGKHTLGLTAFPAQGQPITLTRQITVGNLDTAANPVRVAIDTPSTSGQTTLSGTAALSGWTITDNSTAIQSVSVLVDGVASLAGTAFYGVSRPDVCAAYPGRPGCPNVGWSYSLDTTKLSNGPHMLQVTSTTVGAKRATAGAPFTVSNTAAATTRTVIDSPGPQSIPYAGILFASGWAVKASVAILSVNVTVDGIPNGTATYGVNRPDVCATYPGEPGCPNVGWTYSFDTTTLVDGTHIFGVTAFAADGTSNTVTSSFTVYNWTAATVINGVIDVPNGKVSTPYSGQVKLGGWLFLPNVSISSVLVSVDGVPFGNALSHQSRPDVPCSGPDCPNVGWNFTLDTTYLSNDLHTLAITGVTTSGQYVTQTQQFSTQN